jgi:hypothetical protein
MYKLLIKHKQWKDCEKTSTAMDVYYIARTLSKFSHCHVDVYLNLASKSVKIKSSVFRSSSSSCFS